MFINSFSFFLFFIPVALIFWRLKPQWQWIWLLLASYYFYFSWKPAYAFIIFLVTVVAFFAAKAMEALPSRKVPILWVSALLIFGNLFVFKYLNFFSYTLNDLFRLFAISLSVPQFTFLLPLGISFYTFQVVGYLFDVFRGKSKAEQHFGRLALFVSFFPLAGAGPIERSTNLLAELQHSKKFEYERVVSGLKLFAYGLFKKMVVADNLGIVVDRVFSSLPEYKGLSLILAVFFFSWQIYADFSGYTDMARGLGRILGYDLLENFRWPYLAQSVRDFWRRWHISLSSWLKDYLYIPLGGSRQGMPRTILNTIIVFVVCGLWHGAAWTFVVWGLIHGVVIAIERLFVQFGPSKMKFPTILATAYAYLVISLSWVFFRAANLSDAVYVLKNSLVGAKSFIIPSYIWATLSQMFKTNRLEIALTLGVVATMIVLDFLTHRWPIGKWIDRQSLLVRWSVYVGALSLILLLRNAAVVEFIYFQF